MLTVNTTNHFSHAEAAARYERFRPKVHAVALDWLRAADGERRYGLALDVACGTGDSTQPLLRIADRVDGIDSSQAMLAKARDKQLQVAQATYDAIPGTGYDLITTCMAFHWFDRTQALEAFRVASAPLATWLIYNFAFTGHATDDVFNNWFRNDHLRRYPSPPRTAQEFRVGPADGGLVELAHCQGNLPVTFTRETLIGYLTTQSNIEAQVSQGRAYAWIEEDLDRSMPLLVSTRFDYAYSYTIARYSRIRK